MQIIPLRIASLDSLEAAPEAITMRAPVVDGDIQLRNYRAFSPDEYQQIGVKIMPGSVVIELVSGEPFNIVKHSAKTSDKDKQSQLPLFEEPVDRISLRCLDRESGEWALEDVEVEVHKLPILDDFLFTVAVRARNKQIDAIEAGEDEFGATPVLTWF